MRHAASLFLIVALVIPFLVHRAVAAPAPASPGNGLRILGPAPGNATTPVVNEGRTLQLRVVDAGGQDVAVTQWTSDSPKIAKVTTRGVLKGKLYGFAAVTANTGRGPVSAFVAIARVTRRQGAMAQGDTKSDSGGNVYLSSPSRHVIYQATAVSASVLAGSTGNSGFADGVGDQARFNVPTGLAVDNRAEPADGPCDQRERTAAGRGGHGKQRDPAGRTDRGRRRERGGRSLDAGRGLERARS